MTGGQKNDYAGERPVFTRGDAFLYQGGKELKARNYSGAFEAYKGAVDFFEKGGDQKKLQKAREGLYSASEQIALVYAKEGDELTLKGSPAAAARSYRVAALTYKKIGNQTSRQEMEGRIKSLGPSIKYKVDENVQEQQEKQRRKTEQESKGRIRKFLESLTGQFSIG